MYPFKYSNELNVRHVVPFTNVCIARPSIIFLGTDGKSTIQLKISVNSLWIIEANSSTYDWCIHWYTLQNFHKLFVVFQFLLINLYVLIFIYNYYPLNRKWIIFLFRTNIFSNFNIWFCNSTRKVDRTSWLGRLFSNHLGFFRMGLLQ